MVYLFAVAGDSMCPPGRPPPLSLPLFLLTSSSLHHVYPLVHSFFLSAVLVFRPQASNSRLVTLLRAGATNRLWSVHSIPCLSEGLQPFLLHVAQVARTSTVLPLLLAMCVSSLRVDTEVSIPAWSELKSLLRAPRRLREIQALRSPAS